MVVSTYKCICFIVVGLLVEATACVAQDNIQASKHLADADTSSISDSQAKDDVEEILVTGEQPGPNLYKIYKGDHVLYILPIISPLPKNMQWHSKKVEETLAGAQEFIYPPEVKFHVGFWAQVSLLPSIIGIKDNPDGKKLEEILPADVYQHWAQLKSKYLKDDKKVESMRPIFAASELFKQSIDKSGLAPADNIRWALEAIVKANKITITHPLIQREMEHPRTTVKNFKKNALDDVACFNLTLQRLETDLDGMRLRANAWAVGDLDKLNQLPFQDNQASCESAVMDSQLADETGLRELKKLAFDAWVDAAETALTKNAVTFAFTSFNDLNDKNGYVAQLIRRGYSIE